MTGRTMVEWLREKLVLERQELLRLRQAYDEECSFPLSSNELRLEAIQELKRDGLLPENW